MSNWRRAFYQSRDYKVFSHQSTIVMPVKAIPNAVRNIRQLATASGVGLTTITDDGLLEVLPSPRGALVQRGEPRPCFGGPPVGVGEYMGEPSSPRHYLQALGQILTRHFEDPT